MDAGTIAAELRSAVLEAEPALRALGGRADRRPGPGKWSPKEVIGHLVDSACNNHARFVVAQESEDLVFSTYAQDHWVRAQDYRSSDWNELVDLWKGYNLHLAHVIERASAEAVSRPRAKHNLDRIAFELVPAEEPTTLGYLMADYVTHLRHHLASVLRT